MLTIWPVDRSHPAIVLITNHTSSDVSLHFVAHFMQSYFSSCFSHCYFCYVFILSVSSHMWPQWRNPEAGDGLKTADLDMIMLGVMCGAQLHIFTQQ